MIGHGGPNRLLVGRRCVTDRRRVRRLGIALCTLLFVASRGSLPVRAQSPFAAPPLPQTPSSTTDESPTLRLRFAWGGGQPRQWRGQIRLPGGRLNDVRLLGIEADEPGSMWVNQDQVFIEQKSIRGYDGCDVSVYGPLENSLAVELSAADGSTRQLQVPLSSLLEDQFVETLDDEGNRLFIRRAPGDSLRIEMDYQSLVFAPGERFQGTLAPHLLNVSPGSRLTLSLALRGARGGDELWSDERSDVAEAATATIPPAAFDVPLPQKEGVYEFVVTASIRRRPTPLPLRQTLATRTVQLIVLSDEPPGGEPVAESLPRQVLEIDPANPSWWRRFDLARWIPGGRRGTISGGASETLDHALGRFIQLAPTTGSENDAWQAYPLPISQTGAPHVLEIEYPSDVPQTMGITIVEANTAGTYVPISADSGVHVEVSSGEQEAEIAKHQLVFWPQTKSPMVLITNRRRQSSAVFGRLRVMRYDPQLPSAILSNQASSVRRRMAYLARPLFNKSFSASEAPDEVSGRGFEDWVTFYEGANRLIQYLKYAGYNGLMMAVYADGSAIYPSQLADPTPRFDRGVFFTAAADPLPKDVVEMLFRMCDREGIEFVPAFEFSGTLPAVEALRRARALPAGGFDWVDAEGRPRVEMLRASGHPSPVSYNPVRPEVSEAMTALLHEFTERYAAHRSFGGLAIQFAGHGFAHVPVGAWQADWHTQQRFLRDTELDGDAARAPGPTGARIDGDQRDGDAAWQIWLCDQLKRWQSQVEARVIAARPDARLYLATADLFSSSPLRQALQPTLPALHTPRSALLQLGLDVDDYAGETRIAFLRPYRLATVESLSQRAVELWLNQPGDLDRELASQAFPAAQFFEPPASAPLPSLDATNVAPLWSLRQFTPSGMDNRKRLARAMASLDPLLVVDGGWTPLMGQEIATAGSADVYSRLPAARFEPIASDTDPVTIRTLSDESRTYLYLVNDSPWPVTIELTTVAVANSTLEQFGRVSAWSPLTSGNRATWRVELLPYELAGGAFSMPGVQIPEARMKNADQVRQELAARVRRLEMSAVALERLPSLDALRNPGFEVADVDSGAIAGWDLNRSTDVSAVVIAEQRHTGNASLRLTSGGSVASLVSEPFSAPESGRLSVEAWLRVDDAARQPELRIAIEKTEPQDGYYRYAAVGQGEAGTQLSPQWRQYVFQVDDLGAEGPCRLRVRFDLMAEGEVWLDDVALFDRRFQENERRELTKIIATANVKLQNGKFADCNRLLESYWPQFLLTHVPVDDESLATELPIPTTEPETNAAQESESEPRGVLGRLNRLLPSFMRF